MYFTFSAHIFGSYLTFTNTQPFTFSRADGKGEKRRTLDYLLLFLYPLNFPLFSDMSLKKRKESTSLIEPDKLEAGILDQISHDFTLLAE